MNNYKLPAFYIIWLDDNRCLELAVKLANGLRRRYKVEVSYEKKSLKSSLKSAFNPKLNISFIIIIGEKELSAGILQVKDIFEEKTFNVYIGDLLQSS